MVSKGRVSWCLFIGIAFWSLQVEGLIYRNSDFSIGGVGYYDDLQSNYFTFDGHGEYQLTLSCVGVLICLYVCALQRD